MVVIFLFLVGLKLWLLLGDFCWRLVFVLVFGMMMLNVGLIMFLGLVFLNLLLGVVVLFGVIFVLIDFVLVLEV